MRAIPLLLSPLILLSYARAAQAPERWPTPSSGVVVRSAAGMISTPALKDLASRPPLRKSVSSAPREVLLGRLPRANARPGAEAHRPATLSAASAPRAPRSMPEPLITFEGVDNLDGVLPPDSNGDVGPDHYVCMVNMHFCVYDKATGDPLISPMLMSELFAAAGFPAPASTSDDGDPVVLYDHLADRWLISQFIISVTPCHEVIGISQTGDPTGEWYLYDFVMPNDKMNDYPKFGVWPDGYYMTDNQFNPDNSWGGAGVFVFNRDKMLAGDPSADYQYFDLADANINYGGILPSDLDGPLPPDGAPNYFAMMDDDAWGMSPVDTLYIWEFRVDWDTPANTTFGLNQHPNYTNEVAPFDTAFDGGRNNIPQPGTSQKLDAISDRLMHRLQYRNFGGHESLTVCHTVDENSAEHAGVRYYELRRDLPDGEGFYVYEQSTFAPDGDHRWMGSAALDMYGNLAVGYSVSGTGTYPSIRYAGRMVNDPTGGLFQGEAEMWAGSGSQTHSQARWGDYSMLSVDPADGVTFWYINEYLPTTSSAGWHTRIGSFRLGSPEKGTVQGTVTNLLTAAGITGARVFTTNGYAATTLPGGSYTLNLPTGTHYIAASADGFYTSAAVEVDILLNETNVQDFGLAPIPLRILPRTGLTSSGMEGGPFSPASRTYLFSNASLSELTWTSQCAAAWLTATPPGGDLAAGETASVVLSFNDEASFLAPGTYTVSVVFSDLTEGRDETRAVQLTVSPYVLSLLCEGFDGGLPGDWVVLDNAASGAEWRFDDPGGRGNQTGGDGVFAIADAWYEGQVNMDTELQSPSVDASGLTQLAVRFNNDFWYYSGSDGSNEIADVDVSVNGAAGPWSNVWRQTSSVRGPGTIEVDLTEAAAGQPGVMVRFHYYDAYFDNWWQVDDVCLVGWVEPHAGDLLIAPPAGLAAEGYYPGPFSPERIYRLTNSSDSEISWNAACSAPWFEAIPDTGTLAAEEGGAVTVRISAAASTLAPGLYSGQVKIENERDSVFSTRPVALTVEEPLAVQPSDGFVAAGLEGGPFSPDAQVFTLSNPSSQDVTWTATWASAWLDVGPGGGTLGALATQEVTVSLADEELTVPGTYADTVVFSNILTGSEFHRMVTVAVIEITGELDVFDSIEPTNDLNIPFGIVTAGTPRVEHVTVQNSDPPGGRNLVVNDIFFGLFSENFSGGAAPDWRPDVPGNWSVAEDAYRAETAIQDFMTSVYTGGQTWADASLQVDVWREGDPDNGIGLGFRTSEDLDADGTGQGYLFLIGGNYYSVWRQDGASFIALQGWTYSTAIKTGTATNRLQASAIAGQWRWYVNNTLVWKGSDSGLASGTIALLGYTEPGYETTAFFDNVRVGLPRTDQTLGRKQTYLNANPLSGGRPQGLSHDRSRTILDRLLRASAEDSVEAGPFLLSDLPEFPAVLAPGESVVFDVTFAPTAPGAQSNVITILNNDNDEPWTRVDLSGRAAAGALTGRVTAAHSGDPIAGATISADNGWTNFVASSDSNGDYRLELLIGEWTASASADRFSTSVVSGILISDSENAWQDFVLSGSQLTFGPEDITETIEWGARATNTVCLTNSGPLNLEVWLRARPRFDGSSPVPLPPSDGIFPRGADPASADPAPLPRKPVDSLEPIRRAPARVLCYGIDMDNVRLVSFYSDDPGTFTVVAGTGATFIPCVDFLNGDLSRLYALDDDLQQLVTLDIATAARTVVGAATPATGQSWTGLAGDPDGTLYAASTDISVSKLYRLDPLTGAATYLGDISNAPGIIAIAINGAGELYGLDLVNDNLVHINKTTGAGTVIGDVGFDANYAQGMDFDEDTDTLYLAAYNNSTGGGELRIADVLTGNSALVGAFQDDAEMNMAVASRGTVPWVRLETNRVDIPPEGSVCVSVLFDAGAVPNESSTNLAGLAFTGNFVNEAGPADLTMIVVPDPMNVQPEEAQTTEGLEGGPFDPAQILYAVTNRGDEELEWSVSHSEAWLDVGPLSGTMAAQEGLTVTAAVNSAAGTLAIGSYTDVLVFVNETRSVQMPRPVVLTVKAPPPDYFTEPFSGDNDLSGRMLTFTTNGSASYYEVCSTLISDFPSDPEGGTALLLGDDSFVSVNFLDGVTVEFYGVLYTNLFVGSNGYITFGAGDTDYSESLSDHFGRPRISALFDDLNPASSGTVSWKQWPDRIVVTFRDVPEYGQSSQNSFQFELFLDGTLRLAWVSLAATDGLAGLSKGFGLAGDFSASDLSAYEACNEPLTITASAGEHGSIVPVGDVGVPFGGGTNFLVESEKYWHIADVLTNDQSVGHAFGATTTNYVFWWSNITANGTIHAVMDANLAPHGTPEWWLALHGWTQDFDLAELDDRDEDTYPNEDEYRADTIPTNGASYPRLQRITPQILQFPASTARVYDIQASYAAFPLNWYDLVTNLPGTGSVMSVAHTNAPPYLYRFRVGRPADP